MYNGLDYKYKRKHVFTAYDKAQWDAMSAHKNRERYTTDKGLCFVCGVKPRHELAPGIFSMTCYTGDCFERYLLPHKGKGIDNG